MIGKRRWKVVVGRHAPEHACLWCPELKVMLSVDQILPRISSNVSVFPTEPETNPLQELPPCEPSWRKPPARHRDCPLHRDRVTFPIRLRSNAGSNCPCLSSRALE